MKIYLVRHGAAVPSEVDPAKPLSPEGRKNIEKIAHFLGEKSFPLALILHSEKLRAKQTAEIMDKYIVPGTSFLQEHPTMGPNDPIEPAMERAINEGEDVMLVGHLPFLQKLLGVLVVGHETAELVHFGEGTTVCVASTNSRSWIIEWVVGLDQV